VLQHEVHSSRRLRHQFVEQPILHLHDLPIREHWLPEKDHLHMLLGQAVENMFQVNLLAELPTGIEKLRPGLVKLKDCRRIIKNRACQLLLRLLGQVCQHLYQLHQGTWFIPPFEQRILF
jgi:hypothetical protein